MIWKYIKHLHEYFLSVILIIKDSHRRINSLNVLSYGQFKYKQDLATKIAQLKANQGMNKGAIKKGKTLKELRNIDFKKGKTVEMLALENVEYECTHKNEFAADCYIPKINKG